MCFVPSLSWQQRASFMTKKRRKTEAAFSFSFRFSLCLSRACLGEIIGFMYKWLKKGFSAPGHALIALRVGVSRHHVILVQFHSVLRPATCERRHSFFEFCLLSFASQLFLCLSRACLGFYIQRAQKRRVFSHRSG